MSLSSTSKSKFSRPVHASAILFGRRPREIVSQSPPWGAAIAMSVSKSTPNAKSRQPVHVGATRLGCRLRESFSQPPKASPFVIYPWDRLTLEVDATESILGLPANTEAKLPRAIWWAVMQLHGDDDGEAFNAIFPTISRAVQKDEWSAMFGIAPITTDETTIGKIVSFVMAARTF